MRVGLVVIGLMAACSLQAEITTDGSVGPALELPGPDFEIGAELGQQQGGNLFHSFGRFNVHEGESATFSGPDSVNNVIGRVTGGSPSEIHGTLRSTLPNADLYLANPAGMMFGENARLDVQGSFHATTADSIQFTDGTEFHTGHPGQSNFTSAAPSAFGFLDDAPAHLAVQGSRLQTPEGKTLSLSGGDIRIEQAEITAPAGELVISGFDGPGELTRTDATPETPGGDLIMRDSVLSVSGRGGGAAWIRGGRFELDRSLIQADTLGGQDGRGISVQVESLRAGGGSRLTAHTFGPGKGGDIEFHARGAVEFDGNEISEYGGLLAHSGHETEPEAGGGGALRFSAGELRLRDEAVLETVTFGSARGGDIHARVAGKVRLGGENEFSEGGISAVTIGTGDAGDVMLEAGQVELLAGGILWSGGNPGSSGDGGELTVVTDSLNMAPESYISSGGVEGDGGALTIRAADNARIEGGIITTTAMGDGDSETLTLETGKLEVLQGGIISASTYGRGKGGDIVIDAHEATRIVGKDSRRGSPSSSISTSSDGAGEAGNINLTTGRLEVLHGAYIDTSAYDQGRGGDLNIRVSGDVRISGENNIISSAIQATALGRGDAGNITLQAANVEVSNGGTITVLTGGEGQGGNLRIKADDLIRIKGGGRQYVSSIDAISLDSGNAGDLSLRAHRLDVSEGGQISTETAGSGRGGDLDIVAEESVDVRGRDRQFDSPSKIEAGSLAGGDAGHISLRTSRLNVLDNARLSVLTGGQGHGGAIVIHADLLRVADRAGILAFSALKSSGDAGSARIFTERLEVVEGGVISVETGGGGKGGNLSVIAAGDILLSGADPFYRGGLRAATIKPDAPAGDGGNIILHARRLRLAGGMEINAATRGAGNGGSILIHLSDSLSVSGSGSRIIASTSGRGAAGNVTLNVPRLVLDNQGTIATGTRRGGCGGAITISGDRLLLNQAGLESDSSGEGSGGNIQISLRDTLALDGGFVSSSAQGRGAAGSIRIQARDIVLKNNATIAGTTRAGGAGGTVTLEAEENLRLDRSAILAASRGDGAAGTVTISARTAELTDQARIGNSSQGRGSGGAIVLHIGKTIVLNQSALLSRSESPDRDAGDAGRVELHAPRISLSDASEIAVNTRGGGTGGGILITGENLELLASRIDSGGAGSGAGGMIRLELSGKAELNQGAIVASAQGDGKAGSITLKARRAELKNQAEIINSTSGAGQGNAIILELGEAIVLEHAALLSRSEAVSGKAGDAGRIELRAPQIALGDASEIAVNTRGGGDSGDVLITGENLELLASRIDSDSAGSGAGGRIDLALSDNLVIDRGSISAKALGRQDNAGDGGGIHIRASHIEARNGGLLQSGTEGAGNGGNIFIEAGTIKLRRATIDANSGPEAGGQGGGIRVIAGQLTLEDGGLVTSGARGSGDGGSIELNLREPLYLVGPDNRVSASSEGEGVEAGKGGNIRIDAPALVLAGGAEIISGTYGRGEGGTILINVADKLEIRQNAGVSGISAASEENAGTAGHITVNATNIYLHEQGEIRTSTANADGGGILLSMPEDGFLYLLEQGAITTSVRGGSGRGGDIRIEAPEFILLNQGVIVARAVRGRGGNINLVAKQFLPSADSLVSASSRLGIDGEVRINAPEVEIAGGLTVFNNQFIDTAALQQTPCTPQRAMRASRFIIKRYAGKRSSPDDWRADSCR